MGLPLHQTLLERNVIPNHINPELPNYCNNGTHSPGDMEPQLEMSNTRGLVRDVAVLGGGQDGVSGSMEEGGGPLPYAMARQAMASASDRKNGRYSGELEKGV